MAQEPDEGVGKQCLHQFPPLKKTESGGWEGQCDRFDTITDRLAKHPQNSAEEAADILKAASVSWTQWSCVYALDNFTVDYAVNMDYGTVYHLDPRAF